MSFVDRAGHSGGPESADVNRALILVDKYVGILMDGLKLRSLENCVNLLILADHGRRNYSIFIFYFLRWNIVASLLDKNINRYIISLYQVINLKNLGFKLTFLRWLYQYTANRCAATWCQFRMDKKRALCLYVWASGDFCTFCVFSHYDLNCCAWENV